MCVFQWTVHTDHLFLLGLDPFAHCYIEPSLCARNHARHFPYKLCTAPESPVNGVDYAHFTDGKTDPKVKYLAWDHTAKKSGWVQPLSVL